MTRFKFPGALGAACLSLIAGVLAVSAYAPFHYTWLGLPAFLLGFFLIVRADSVKPAFLRAWLFALGLFAPGLYWTVRSMNEFGRLPMPLALLGLLLLAAFLALFWGAAAGLAARISKTLLSRAFMLASFLTLAEWLRGEGLADFAWLTPALALLDTSLEGLAPLGGAHLINFAFFTSLAALAVLLLGKSRARFLLLLIPVALKGLGFWGMTETWSEPAGRAEIRLIQPGLPVVDGWSRATAAERLDAVSSLMKEPWPAGEAPKLLLTPEGILTTDILRLKPADQEALVRFVDAAGGVPMLFNGFRRDEAGGWRNSSFFAADGRLTVTDKRKLVPFGEFVPPGFRWFVDLLGIPLTDLTPGSMDQKNLQFGKNFRAGVLICYENIDGEVLRSFWKDPDGAPQLLLVTANLGWFHPMMIGQHLDMTRLLAWASARPAASVNMDGFSAFVGPDGRVTALARGSGKDVLAREAELREGPATPYIRFGNAAALILSALLALAAFIAGRRTQSPHVAGLHARQTPD
mgnify:CR=1 FL=1